VEQLTNKNLILFKLRNSKEFRDLFLKNKKIDEDLHIKTKIVIKDNKKYIPKNFFETLKCYHEKIYKISESFLDLFENPYLIEFIGENEYYYIFKIDEFAHIYKKMELMTLHSMKIYLNKKINEYFQEKFKSKFYLYINSIDIEDILITNGSFKAFSVEKLNLTHKLL
jgi:hypothetical protein